MLSNEQIQEAIEVVENVTGMVLMLHDRKTVVQWLNMGFDVESIIFAIELTFDNYGKINFRYTDQILWSWEKEGYHTIAEVKAYVDASHPKDDYLQSLYDTLAMCELIIQNRQVLGEEKVQQAIKLKVETEQRIKKRRAIPMSKRS